MIGLIFTFEIYLSYLPLQSYSFLLFRRCSEDFAVTFTSPDRTIRLNTCLDVDVSHLAIAQLIVDVQLGRSITVHEILFAMHLAQIAYRSDRTAAAFEGFAKGRAKLAIEVRVNQRVQSAVEIAHPEHRRYHQGSTLARVAQRRDDIPVSNTHLHVNALK